MSFSRRRARHGESQRPPKIRDELTLAASLRCDERFIGYGGNKAACLFELYLSGVSFYVLPDDFLIHQSHAYAEKARKHERRYNRKLYTDFREELCFRYLNLFLDQIDTPRAKVRTPLPPCEDRTATDSPPWIQNLAVECKKIKGSSYPHTAVITSSCDERSRRPFSFSQASQRQPRDFFPPRSREQIERRRRPPTDTLPIDALLVSPVAVSVAGRPPLPLDGTITPAFSLQPRIVVTSAQPPSPPSYTLLLFFFLVAVVSALVYLSMGFFLQTVGF